jgi:hypothetical protein
MPFTHAFDLGIYDPDAQMTGEDVFAVESAFFSWYPDPGAALTGWLSAAAGRHRLPLLTLQPYAIPGNEATLLTDITAGLYDAIMSAVVAEINAATFYSGKLYLRWGPEMDVITGRRYPWAVAPSVASTYVAAYDYVTNYFRQHVTAAAVSTVWSPVADSSDALAYYPPSGVSVDFVATSVYEWTLFALDYGFGKPKTPGLFWYNAGFRSFADILKTKLPNLPSNKSLLIAECGISTTGTGAEAGTNFGSKTYQREWAFAGFESIKRGDFPLVSALVYSNSTDPADAWAPYETVGPDFHISTDVFRSWFGE